MKNYHLSKPDEMTKSIISACFPTYKGRKIQLSTLIPSRLDSYWDGGSKTSYVFYHLDQRKALPVHTNHPLFEANQPRDLKTLPLRLIIVAHSYFCGKDMGITIYANEQDLSKLLPDKPNDLTENELIVLKYTSGLKNTYGGRTHIRFKEANRKKGINREDWLQAKQTCINKGLLRKNGSITSDGRNAINY